MSWQQEQHGMDMPLLPIPDIPDEEGIEAQADRARKAPAASIGRKAHSLDTVIKISFLTGLNHAASCRVLAVRQEISEGEIWGS